MSRSRSASGRYVRPTASFLAAALLVVLSASPVPAASARITLAPAFGPPTGSVTVKGTGFGSNEAVTVAVDGSQVAGAQTDGSGAFSAPFHIPSAAAPGTHTVHANGSKSGLSASSPLDVRTDWPRFHSDAASGGKNLSENVIGIDDVTTLVKRWSYQTGGLVRSSPVVADHMLYVGSDDGNVYALSATTGAFAWSYQTGAAVRSVPDVQGGVVYVGSNDRSVYALDAATGAKVWSFATGGAVVSSPDVVAGTVYVGSNDGKLYALKASNGSKIWSFATGGAVATAPAVQGSKVFVGSFDGTFYALDAASGTIVWTKKTGGPIEASPSVANANGTNVLFVGSDDANIYALDADDGSQLWAPYVSAGRVYSTAAISVSEGFWFIGTHNWNIQSFKLSTGDLRWLYSCPKGMAVYSSPAVANGVVFFGCRNGWVYALYSSVRGMSPARLPVWSFKTGGPIYSSPAVSDGLMYIGSDDGAVYAFGPP